MLVLLGFVLYRRQKAKARRSEEALRDEHDGIQVSLFASAKRLEKHNENLQESLRKKKHSEDELEVMKKAMSDMTAARSDELKEVLISSTLVKVDRLLGKGGFGVVNLATYKGQQVAMKQLITITKDSVKRFR